MTIVGNRLLLDRKKVIYDIGLVESLAREHEDKGELVKADQSSVPIESLRSNS